MKHVSIKIVFYLKKFGLGITIDKMPIVFPYAYKITFQIGWVESCIFLYNKTDSWNR
jgi:hypothetical protein